MHNLGILKRIQTHILKMKLPKTTTTFQSVALREVIPLYTLITMSSVVALCLMILEKMCQKYTRIK